MDERFRFDGTAAMLFKAYNGVVIQSQNRPEMRINCLYLRGDRKSSDNEIFVLRFSSKQKASDEICRYKAALKEWSEQWEGWTILPKEHDNDEHCGIVEF